MINGERIGTLKRDGCPTDASRSAYNRFANGRLIFDFVISGVLAGSGRVKVEIGEQGDNGDLQYAVQSHPPIEDPAEAQRLGREISGLLDRPRGDYQDVPLESCEVDTFIPAQPK